MNKLKLILASRKPTILIGIFLEKYLLKRNELKQAFEKHFQDKKGIEIGGPSNMFKPTGQLPIYPLAAQVDGCNFSDDTAWEGKIKEGNTYNYGGASKGYQFICDGVDVPTIPKNSYDFVLSCNNLEHIANPLKAVENWLKLLKPNGAMVLVLPRRESNFDHKRPITTIEHLIQDYETNIGEDDLTHVEEVFKLHDLRLDPLAGNFENFQKRCLDNFNNRCLHHHVFDLALLKQICNFFKLEIMLTKQKVDNYIIIAKLTA